jgi:hypothetical protein
MHNASTIYNLQSTGTNQYADIEKSFLSVLMWDWSDGREIKNNDVLRYQRSTTRLPSNLEQCSFRHKVLWVDHPLIWNILDLKKNRNSAKIRIPQRARDSFSNGYIFDSNESNDSAQKYLNHIQLMS